MSVKSIPSIPADSAAAAHRAGLFYRGDLITERIPGAVSLSQALDDRPTYEPLLEPIGRCIRRFHDQGIWHADLNAHNILFDEAKTVWLIDFDRGRRRRPGRWQAGNLLRLRRSLDKLSRQGGGDGFSEEDWERLLDGYRSA